jgi:uncharacterized membrane protein YhfC
MVIAMSIVSVIIAVVVPVALAAYTTRRFKLTWTLVLYGAMAFVFANLVNGFLLNGLGSFIENGKFAWTSDAWFPFAYPLVIGIVTGLLEQGANWLAFKLSGDKGESWGPALGVGLGHGGMVGVLVGTQLGLSIFQVITLQTQGVEALTASGVDAATAATALASLKTTPWYIPLASGVDILLTLVIQVTAAVLTWFTFRKLGWKWFAAAVGLQAVASAIAMITYYAGFSVWASEGVTFLVAAVCVYILYLVKTRVVDKMPAPVVVVETPKDQPNSTLMGESKTAKKTKSK